MSSDEQNTESADREEEQLQSANVELSIKLGADKFFRIRAVGATVSLAVAILFFAVTMLAVLGHNGYFDNGAKKDGQQPPKGRVVDQDRE